MSCPSSCLKKKLPTFTIFPSSPPLFTRCIKAQQGVEAGITGFMEPNQLKMVSESRMSHKIYPEMQTILWSLMVGGIITEKEKAIIEQNVLLTYKYV